MYASTTLDGASPMAAPTSAWVQKGVIVPGAILARTARTKAFEVGMNIDERRIFDIAEICNDENRNNNIMISFYIVN